MQWIRIENFVFLILTITILAGCTPHYKHKHLRKELAAFPQGPARPSPIEGYLDLKGAIHVHSYLSHDSEGTPVEILQGAKTAGLNFIVMTDHDTPLIFTEGMQGRHGDILVIRGMEIIKGCRGTADRCASLLGIGLKDYFDHRHLTFQQVIEEVNRQGGLAFVAHPRGWPDWSLEGITGIEIYDVLDDVLDKKWKFPKYFFDILYSYEDYPAETILSIQDRPKWHLKKWDALTEHRRVVGIAGNDAHQNVKILGHQLDPYPLSFRFVATHVLAQELDETSVLSALRAGRAYTAFDLLSDATDFLFGVFNGGHHALMGDELNFSTGQILLTRAPRTALILLFKNGKEITRCRCQELSFPIQTPGVYRAEVLLRIQNRWRPWIYSNPVYIR